MAMQTTDRLIAAPRGSYEEAVAFFSRIEGIIHLDEVKRYLRCVFDIAPKLGLDPAILIAHASHETNYFRSRWWRDRLNPAGMGITGTRSQDNASPYFRDGAHAADAHMAHMVLYATGTIPEPLSTDDDPRYEAYENAYGVRAMATTIEELTGKWAWDEDFHIGVTRQGNEIFPNLEDSKPREEEQEQEEDLANVSKLMYNGSEWQGWQSIRINRNLYRASRRTVTVNVDALNTRKYAGTYDVSPVIRTLPYGTKINVIGSVKGERVGTEDRWWISDHHERIWAGGTSEKP